MLPPKRTHSRRSAGKGLTEYIIIIFLIAVGTIGVIVVFGDNIRGLFGSGAESLRGQVNVSNPGMPANTVKWTMKGDKKNPYRPMCRSTGTCTRGIPQ